MSTRMLVILAAPMMFFLAGCAGHGIERAPPGTDQMQTLEPTPAPPLRFDIQEGRLLNVFFRNGPAAAHLLLRSSDQPRMIVAFPAGNSGVGVWFDETLEPVQWRVDGAVRAIHERDPHGRSLHGITADLVVDAERLVVSETVLGSIRTLRDYELSATQPDAVQTGPVASDGTVRWARDRLDGAPGYALSLEAIDGSRRTDDHGRVVLAAAPGAPLRLRLRALTGEPPLTPLPAAQLLRDGGHADVRSAQVLEFLSYREKFLAGSWRFDTYFGRDTLMSLRLLMPALQPAAVESGLDSVLARLSPRGEVAHEEDIGEFAILRRLGEGAPANDAPIYDYTMVDDDMMLAPVAAAWLLEDPRGRARAADFLAASATGGERNGHALVRNLTFVAERTRAFAVEPAVDNLIGLKPGRKAGQWRDSDDGLGGGRYPYDVNAVFAPAALRAADALVRSGMLDAYLTPGQRGQLDGAAAQASEWERHAPGMFELQMPSALASIRIREYAAHLGVLPGYAPEGSEDRPLVFHAVALDAAGQPVPVLHSDAGFALLFASPSPRELADILATSMRPFPAGLMSEAGLLVANPVFGGPGMWERLDASAYHGTVVWSWQQAVWAAGFDRQLARDDLGADLRNSLRDARSRLWSAIEANRALRTSELWSWSYRDGTCRPEPFGARGGDADESNAAQLWSTVFLALSPPAAHHVRDR
ncbi:MAG: hypothetical protein M3Q42_11745 [Pseudomonadota bacterium]|nr:hypothetical protein [Pseudomonadota bacterium]